MEEDKIEDYVIYANKYRRYRCDLCDYYTAQKKDLVEHLCSRRHRYFFTLKLKNNQPSQNIPILSPIISSQNNNNNNNINLIIHDKKIKEINKSPSPPPPHYNDPTPSPTPTPPPNKKYKPKLKGKTFLTTNCDDALTIDLKLPYLQNWGRQLIITIDDVVKWKSSSKPNDFLLYFFLKLTKEINLNNMPFRCLDVSRKKFFYHDVDLGWTEDIGNIQINKLINCIFANVDITAGQLIKDGEIEIEKEVLIHKKMTYILWGQARQSEEETINKSQKRADIEKNDGLEILARILQIDED